MEEIPFVWSSVPIEACGNSLLRPMLMVISSEESVRLNERVYVRAGVRAQYLEGAQLFLVTGGEEPWRRVVSAQRVQSSSWKVGGPRVDGGVEGWFAADGPLPRCQFMTYSRVKLNVRGSQYQIHHLPISLVSTPLSSPIDCFFVNPWKRNFSFVWLISLSVLLKSLPQLKICAFLQHDILTCPNKELNLPRLIAESKKRDQKHRERCAPVEYVASVYVM